MFFSRKDITVSVRLQKINTWICFVSLHPFITWYKILPQCLKSSVNWLLDRWYNMCLIKRDRHENKHRGLSKQSSYPVFQHCFLQIHITLNELMYIEQPSHTCMQGPLMHIPIGPAHGYTEWWGHTLVLKAAWSLSVHTTLAAWNVCMLLRRRLSLHEGHLLYTDNCCFMHKKNMAEKTRKCCYGWLVHISCHE